MWELKRLLYDLIGHVPVTWRTICQLPLPSGKFAASFEQTFLQHCPFGAFAGMVVDPRSCVCNAACSHITRYEPSTARRREAPGMTLAVASS